MSDEAFRPFEESAPAAPVKPSKWPGIWGIIGGINFAIIFVLLSPLELSGVEAALLGLFALAAVVESIFLYFNWKSALQGIKENINSKNNELQGVIKETVLTLSIIGAIGVAIFSSPQVGLFEVPSFVVPLVFSIAVGIRALFNLFQAGVFAFKSYYAIGADKKSEFKEKAVKEFYLFLVMGMLTAAVPAVMIYKIPHLNWLGFAASCLLVGFQFYQVVIQPLIDRYRASAAGYAPLADREAHIDVLVRSPVPSPALSRGSQSSPSSSSLNRGELPLPSSSHGVRKEVPLGTDDSFRGVERKAVGGQNSVR